jgi:hypothetical protein
MLFKNFCKLGKLHRFNIIKFDVTFIENSIIIIYGKKLVGFPPDLAPEQGQDPDPHKINAQFHIRNTK